MPDCLVTGEGKVTIFLLHGIYGAKDFSKGISGRLPAPLRGRTPDGGCRVLHTRGGIPTNYSPTTLRVATVIAPGGSMRSKNPARNPLA